MFLSWSRFFLVTEAIKDQSCVNETFHELLFTVSLHYLILLNSPCNCKKEFKNFLTVLFLTISSSMQIPQFYGI